MGKFSVLFDELRKKVVKWRKYMQEEIMPFVKSAVRMETLQLQVVVYTFFRHKGTALICQPTYDRCIVIAFPSSSKSRLWLTIYVGLI